MDDDVGLAVSDTGPLQDGLLDSLRLIVATEFMENYT